ncbi:MAG: hypothetical protein ACOVOS_02245 [Chitinophagaceae bacterium]
MKKFILFVICAGFFMTASAQARVGVGVSFGSPVYGMRPMYYAPRPVVVAPRRVVYARPYHPRRVVVVPAPRGRAQCYGRRY